MATLPEKIQVTVQQLTAKAAELLSPDAPPDPLLSASRFIGKPVPRVDGPLKVTGRATYTADNTLNGLVYAYPVHSSVARGRISYLDTAAAESLAGVLAVMTHHNAPPMKTPAHASYVSLEDPLTGSPTTLPVMSAEIFWNGQVVAVVVADTLEVAAYAASLVRVSYATEPAALALAAEKPAAFTPEHVLFQPAEVKKGDAEAMLAGAPVVVDAVYTTPLEKHNAIEPHATTAVWHDKAHVTVYDCTQAPTANKEALADMFGLPPEGVRIITTFIGGAFGGKTMWSHVPLAVAVAQLVQRPVKLTMPRASVNLTVGGRTATEQRVALGATADGRLTALIHTGYTTVTRDVFAEQFSFAARHLYAVPALHIWQKVVRLDQVQNSFMRAPGEAPGTFALESAMDELAHKLGLDPVALRLRNEPARDPTTDAPFSSRYLREAYTLGASRFGWSDARPAPGSAHEGEWQVGTGVATAYYPTNFSPVTVRTRIGADGTVSVATASMEMGVGAATVQTQHIAERFGVPLARARYEQGDTNLPISRAAGGSSATASVGSAIWASAEQLTDTLLHLAQQDSKGPLYQADRADVELRAGGLYLKKDPTAGASFEVLLAGQDQPFVEVEAVAAALPPQYSMASYGAHFCEVRVHSLTREVRVKRVVSVLDCGRVLNPRTAASQLKGAIVMGVGMALLEEGIIDERTGRLMNPTLAEYHVPVLADVPAIDVHFLDVPDPHMPLGLKSMGELGMTGIAAAIANAVFHATGTRVRNLPITVDKLL